MAKHPHLVEAADQLGRAVNALVEYLHVGRPEIEDADNASYAVQHMAEAIKLAQTAKDKVVTLSGLSFAQAQPPTTNSPSK